MRVGIRGRRLGRVAAAFPVYMIKPLGLGVLGGEVLIGERPGRRHPVGMLHDYKIALAQPQQHRAVHLGVAPDPVMDPGMERFSLLVVPGLACLVALAGEDRFGAPVFRLPRQVVATLQDQNALPRWGEPVGEGAAAGAAADDDDVVTISAHDLPPWPASRRSRSGRCSDAL